MPALVAAQSRTSLPSPALVADARDSVARTAPGSAAGLPLFLQNESFAAASPSQPKRIANDRDGPDEREAEQVAEAFVKRPRSSAPQNQASADAPDGKLMRAPRPAGDGGERIPFAARQEFEAFFGTDLSGVRVHTDASANRAARTLSASAFTHGSDVYFAAGKFAPTSPAGKRLLAHELAHTQQPTSSVAQRQADPPGVAPAQSTRGPEENARAETSTAGAVTFDELRSRELYVALLVEQLSANYRSLIREIDPVLDRAGIYDRPMPENAFQRAARRRVFAYEQTISSGDLYDAVHLSSWLEHMTSALETLAPLLQALRTVESADARQVEMADVYRRNMLTTVGELSGTAYIRAGVTERRRLERVARAERRVADAVEFIRETLLRVWRPDLSDLEGDLHGLVIASRLVHRMRLSAGEIRDVFDALRAEDPRLLQAALMRGGTVRALLQMGVGGLQAYRTEGEGLLAGVIRGSEESRLAQRPGQRVFSASERLIAVGGFIAGAFQGVGDSIISNVKAIVELFTPSFWRGLVNFITRFLPTFIDNEEFRFQLGQMVGLFDADEERRLAAAEPFEYGRTFGHVFGMALTEIVLTFIGLGFILKALNGSARLQRLARPLVAIAEGIARSAIAARGLRVVEAIAEAINALSRRVRRLSMLLPDLTPNARLRRTLFEIEETEREVQAAFNRAQELERLAREALAAANEQQAQQRLRELGEATDELERRVASTSSTAQAATTRPPARMGTVSAGPEGVVEHRPSTPVVERVPETRGGGSGGGGRRGGGGGGAGGRPAAAPDPNLERIAERYEQALVDNPHLMRRFEELERLPSSDPTRASKAAALEADLARVHGGEVPPRARPEPLTSSDVERRASPHDTDVEGPTTVEMPLTLSVDELARFRDVAGRTERHHSFFRYLLGSIQRSRGETRLPRHGRLVVLETPTHQAGLHDLWDMMYPQLARREGAAQEIAEAIARGDRLAETGEILTPTVIADRLEAFYRNVSAAHPDMLSPENLDLILRVVRSIRRRAGI